MTAGCPVPAIRPSQRPFKRTTRSAGARKTAVIFMIPSARRNAMEIHVPRRSSHCGAAPSCKVAATNPATSVTMAPCPSEKKHPDQRASRGRVCALWRASPSRVARWSGSIPCRRPSRNTISARPAMSCGRGEVILFDRDELVPELEPFFVFVDQGDRIEHQVGKGDQVALHLSARGKPPHGIEKP